MLIQSHLFEKGFMSQQLSLYDILSHHEQQTINKIKKLALLDDMTDSFLTSLVKDSLVEPLVIHFDDLTRNLRTEQFGGSEFPFDFTVRRGNKYPKTVARITLPFSGDTQLLRHTPNEYCGNFPQGEVRGHTIQFDIVLWGYQDDERRVKELLEDNLRLIKKYGERVAKQVKQFNEGLPEKVNAAFNVKLGELTQQHSIFDKLGIKEEVITPLVSAGCSPVPQPKKQPSRATYIIQFVANQYVQQLNQTNNNIGDVNNAIQSV
jgi:hypothetical protein